jgi:hypothetical protein
MIGNIEQEELQYHLLNAGVPLAFRKWCELKDLKTVFNTCDRLDWLGSIITNPRKSTLRQYQLAILFYLQIADKMEDGPVKQAILEANNILTSSPYFIEELEDMSIDAESKSMEARILGQSTNEVIQAKKFVLYKYCSEGDFLAAATDVLAYGIVSSEDQVKLFKETLDIIQIQECLIMSGTKKKFQTLVENVDEFASAFLH